MWFIALLLLHMKIRFIINRLVVALLFLSLLFSCSKENSIKIEVLNVEAYKELFYRFLLEGHKTTDML